MLEQETQQEIQRICRKVVPDRLPSATNLDGKGECQHFHEKLSSTYYDKLTGHTGASFANLVQSGEHVEDGFKTGKIKDYQMLFN